MIYKHNGSIITDIGGKWLSHTDTPPLPPIPLNTVRVRTSDGNVPFKSSDWQYDSATLITGTTDVYDVFKDDQSFEYILAYASNVVEILGANTTGITNMERMFQRLPITSVPLFDTSNVSQMFGMFEGCTSLTSIPLFDTSNVRDISEMFDGCTSLTSIPLFDTSNVTTMSGMFYDCISLTSVPLFNTSNVTNLRYMFLGCTSLTTIPLFNTSNVTDIEGMFNGCYNVQSGALALYQQASSQTNPPTNHSGTFQNCGRDTTTGSAELAQIPSDWK